VQSMRRRPTDIPQDALQQRHMWYLGVMHVEACLLDGEGDVRPRHSEKLQRAHRTAVCRGVVRGRTVVGQLVLGVDRCRSSFAVLLTPFFWHVSK
jgi:hypothetical protein